MFAKRFISHGLLSHEILRKNLISSIVFSSHSSLSVPLQSRVFSMMNSVPKLLSHQCHSFSTYKKNTKSSQKIVHKILKSEMKTYQNGERYLVLYEAQKQKHSFMVISVLMLFFFGLTIVKIYHTESSDRRDDYLVLMVIAVSFAVYQKRIFNTVKKITLNSRGDKILITTFNVLGKGQKQLEAPIQLMTGYGRATRLGGYILTGGGKATGFKEMKFWFTKHYITDRPTFEYVAHGKCPKIVDQFCTL